MEEKPFWQTFLTGADPSAARRLNEAAVEVNGLAFRSAEAGQHIATLFELDRAQGHDIARLQAAVWVLMQLLAETRAVDGAVLGERLDAALAEVDRKYAATVIPVGPSFP